MATIEEGLYAALSGYGPVTNLVGSRIYPMVIPQEAALPAIAYQRVSGPRLFGHGGSQGTAAARIQVVVTAEEYRTTKSIVTAIRDLFPFRGTLGGLVEVFLGVIDNEVDGYGPQVEAATVRVDLWFLYAE